MAFTPGDHLCHVLDNRLKIGKLRINMVDLVSGCLWDPYPVGCREYIVGQLREWSIPKEQ